MYRITGTKADGTYVQMDFYSKKAALASLVKLATIELRTNKYAAPSAFTVEKL